MENLISTELNSSGTADGIENSNIVTLLGDITWYKFLIDGILVVGFAILGIVGNALSVIILRRPKMRSSISILLIGLAVADSLFIFITSVLLGWPTIFLYFDFDITATKIGKIAPYLVPAGTTSHMASIYYTIVVTVERYLAVCHPLKAKTICTVQRAYFTVITVAVLTNLCQIPRWFEYTYDVSIDENNVTHYVTAKTALLQNRTYMLYYVGLGYVVFEYLIPITTLITLNILIYKAIRKSHKERRTLSSTQLHENSLAVMLSIVVLVYLICHALPLVNLAFGIITGYFEIPGFDSVRNFLIVFNSSINFVIYCTYGKKFRGALVESLSEFRQSSLSKLGLLGNESSEQNSITTISISVSQKQG